MASCHECGSEVAEIDVFCPFCGISLKPIAMNDEPDDVSFESTIVMTQPEEATPAETSIDTAFDTDTTPNGPGRTEENVPMVTSDHGLAANEVTLEEIDVPDESSESIEEPEPKDSTTADIYEVPVPAALAKLESTAGQLFKDLERSRPLASNTDEPAAQEPGTSEYDTGISAKSESPAATLDEVEQNTGESPDLTASDKPEASEDQTPPFVGEPDEVQFSEAEEKKASDFEGLPSIEAVYSPDSVRHEASVSDNASVPDNVEEFEEISISKPLDVPVAEDEDSTPSKFDSVRIMETPQTDTISESVVTGPESAKPSVSGSMSAGTGEADREARSHTTPNIGLVDTDGRKAAKLKPLEEGAILNSRYEIVRKIGGGGMGAVYLSSDNNLGGVLRAVKEMVQSHIEEEQQEKAIQDFKRESMILSTLDHPSIPTIYDYFFDDQESRFYLVMKYISGGDLAARLRAAPEGKLDEITVTEWAIQLADVLDYLHNQPTTIVYRDLKPSNIMIDGNSGRVMLIDFGIARSIGQKEEKGVTAVGTMGYAPPELFSGNVEPRSDIYSLGSTMFHLLTGADPQSNPLLIFDFQKNPRPRQINPQLSDQVERFLMKAVEYNAASRFGSASEVRHFLEEHLDNLRKGNVTYGVKEIPASISLANQSVFCGFCGQKIVATDLFCAFCGAKQPIAQQGVHSEIYTPVAMTAKLFVVGTSDLESPTFQLEKSENLIGRRDPMSNIFPEVDLSKYDPQTKISRRHAKIWREGSNYLLEDLASSNGTVIFPASSDSRRLLPRQPYTLSNGDKIKLGDTTLHFIVG